MLWIKRNLFLVVGGVVALGLLVFGGYYLWTNYQKNSLVEEELRHAQQDLKSLYGLNPFPSQANITQAQAELQKLQNAIRKTQTSFSPLPYQRVKGQAFKTLLDTTVDELQKKATEASVALPQPKGYAFTFGEQQKRLQFSEGSFPTLPEQLAEIKAICTILFQAKINKLTSLRRGRVTSDDPPAANDYHEMKFERTLANGAVASPYVAEFTSFSSELAAVLEGFYVSPHGLIVKAVEVKSFDDPNAAPPPPPPPNAVPNLPPNVLPRRPPLGPQGGPVRPRTPPLGAGATPPPGAAAGEGMKTVLDEKMLRITLWVDVLKLPAK